MKTSAILLIAAFFGCGTSSDSRSSISISSKSGPAVDNIDLFDANVVTDLADLSVLETAFCSGILLTRTRVLTASHCVVGLPNLSVGPSPPVQVGSVRFGTTGGTALTSQTPPTSPISELGHYTDPNNPNDVGADLAILVLDEDALRSQLATAIGATSPIPQPGYSEGPREYPTDVDTSDWGTLLGTNIVRPSFTGPVGGTVQFAAWGTAQDRQIFSYTGTISLVGNSFAMVDSGAVRGDSGGPIFSTRLDGSRDPFGLLSGGDEYGDATFVSLVSPQNSGWIVNQLTDHSHDAQPNWKTMHRPIAGRSSWWIGEDDYSGPCDQSIDLDCDHWVDTSDNCPVIFNHDQTDTDDDGTGDACSTNH